MFKEVTLNLLRGFGMTCSIFLMTLLIALPFGLIICYGSMSRHKVISYPVRGIIWVIRGTPLMLQIIIVYYVPGILFGIKWLPEFPSIVLAFSINYACYFSEIYRSGIQSVPRGQFEAGQVLGMKRGQIFRKITLFQVIRRILPPMSNEIITLVKDTALARVIGVAEILFRADGRYMPRGIIWPLFYSGAFYLIFVGILTVLFHFAEKKLSYYKI